MMALSLALCFIPLGALFASFALLTEDFKVWEGLLACAIGLVAVVPIAAIQFFFQNMFDARSLGALFLRALLFNGLIEESVKTLLLFVLPAGRLRLKVFFFYALLAGMSLGCFESLLYLISGYERVGLRLVTAVVIHTFCGGLGGLFVYGIKAGRIRTFPFLFAVLLHGVYNYFAGLGRGSVYFYLAFAVIVLAALECRVQYTREAAWEKYRRHAKGRGQ